MDNTSRSDGSSGLCALEEFLDGNDEKSVVQWISQVSATMAEEFEQEHDVWEGELFDHALENDMMAAVEAMIANPVFWCERYDVAEWAAKNGRPHLFEEFAKDLPIESIQHVIWVGKKHSGKDPCIEAVAAELIGEQRKNAWAAALREGLAARWEKRVSSAYEKACAKNKIPLWSAASACERNLSPSAKNFFEMPEAACFRQGPLGNLEAATGWSELAFSSWRLELAKAGALESELADFEEMEKSCVLAVELFAKGKKAIKKAVKEQKPERVEKIAKKFKKTGAQRWIPLLVAWAWKPRFGEFDSRGAAAIEPLLAAALVDKLNVGLIAAGIDSEQRAALLAALVERGRVCAASLEVVSGRIEDLGKRPGGEKMLAVPWARIVAEAERAQIDSSLATNALVVGGAGGARPRQL